MPSHPRTRRARAALVATLAGLALVCAGGSGAVADGRHAGPAPAPAGPGASRPAPATPSAQSAPRDRAARPPVRHRDALASATTSPPPAPADAVGTPGDSTLLRTDSLLVDKTTGSGGRSARWDQTTPDMKGLAAQGDALAETTRDDLNPQYPTAAGRFRDVYHDRAMAFRLVRAGDGGLLQLGTTDDTAQTDWRRADGPVGEAALGETFVVSIDKSQDGEQHALTAASGSTDVATLVLGAVVDAAAAAPTTAGWTLVDAGDGYVKLVNHSDGLCLDDLNDGRAAGAPVGTYPCDPFGGPQDNQLWRLVPADSQTYTIESKYSGLTLSMAPSRTDAGSTVTLQPRSGPGEQRWNLRPVVETGGAVPTWSVRVASASTPFAFDVGDLDRAVTGTDPEYHDEAAVAYADDDHRLQVRVVDYNATPGGPLVTTLTDSSMPTLGTTEQGRWMPGSLGVAIGAFDGGATNQVAVTWQDGAGSFHVKMWRYRADGSERSASEVVGDSTLVASSDSAPNTLTSGFASTSSGNLDGSGPDDLAVAYGTVDRQGGGWKGHVAVGTFSSSLALTDTASMALQATTYRDFPNLLPESSTVSAHGMRLVPGLFRYDGAAYDLHRRQLAVSYVALDPNVDLSRFGQVPMEVDVVDVERRASCRSGCLTLSVQATTSLDVPSTNGAHRPQLLYIPAARPAPASLTAGAFPGIAKDDSVPLWGIAVSTVAYESYNGDRVWSPRVLVLGVDGSALTARQSSESLPQDQSAGFHLTAYDRTGTSQLLGAPRHFRLSNISGASVIVAQPPAHVDWANDTFTNVSDYPASYNVELSRSTSDVYTTKHTTKTAWTLGVGGSVKSETKVSENLFGVEKLGGTLDVTGTLQKEFASDAEDYSSFTQEKTVRLASKTGNDDVIDAYWMTADIYRYPIISTTPVTKDGGTPVTTPTCSADCRAYYEVAIPGPTTFASKVGQDSSIDWYQPSWQNGNALSYPALQGGSSPVPVPDLGSYTFGGSTVTAPLFNSSVPIASSDTTESLDLSSTVGGGTTRTSSGSLAGGLEVSAGLSMEVSVGVASGSEEVTASVKVDGSSSWSDLDLTESSSTTAQSFTLHAPPIEASRGYTVGTVYYTAADGTQKIVHGVDLTSGPNRGEFWRTQYGQHPDPALNLPNAIDIGWDALGVYDKPEWAKIYGRELIRGFTSLQPPADDGQGVTQVPYVDNPYDGQSVSFSVPVHNYSLVASPPVDVHFYAVPLDANGINPVRGVDPVPIGSVVHTSAIAAQGSQRVQSDPWTAPAPAGGAASQQWRIFVVLDPDNRLDEIHPLDGGQPCPISSLDSESGEQTPLVDPMTGTTDTHACGQNNQGFGEITVSRRSAQSTGAKAKVRLGGARFFAPPAAGTGPQGTAATQAPSQYESVAAAVTASSTADTNRNRTVLVFDGKPSGSNLIASTHLRGAGGAGGGLAPFEWQPQSAGRHVLYAQLLDPDGGPPTTSTIEVTVAPSPRHPAYGVRDLPGLVRQVPLSAAQGLRLQALARLAVDEHRHHHDAAAVRRLRSLERDLRALAPKSARPDRARALADIVREVRRDLRHR